MELLTGKNTEMEDNALITKFMGVYKYQKPTTSAEFRMLYKLIDNQWCMITKEGEERFSTSWDWLMPVIKKINEIHRQGPSIAGINVEFYKVLSMEIDTEIEYVYEGVVNFIKWYNKNNKK